jgi:hypothetical protein
MLDGRLEFLDAQQSAFQAFGAGRTLPVQVGNRMELRIGAVIEILEGFGRIRGLPGTVVVNGYIQPPDGLALNLMIRLMDPSQTLTARGSLPGLSSIIDPDPESVFLALLGEPDPRRPTTLNQAPDGRILGSNVREILRFVDIGFDLSGSRGIRARLAEGSVAGSLEAELHFNPMDPNPVSPISTRQGVFTFLDGDGGPVGTLRADMIEGRSFQTKLPGLPAPVFRFGGFGPFLEGTGLFRGAIGMMSLNAAISVFPRTLSNLYILRVCDADGAFRKACREVWTPTRG